jgi:acyl-CoA synthetase (AMP-forming)/AMP-acid ligase II
MDDTGREVAPGQSGEIWIAGPMVVPGYWQNLDADRENFVGGYWKSGDIGSKGEDGYVRVFDRKKDMINRGGYKIYSVEVENLLIQHPAILECAVIGRPDPVLGEKSHAFVVSSAPGLSDQALRDYCATRLADYKIPDGITIFAEPLPRNANGKVIKTALRARLLESVPEAR